MFAVLPSIDNQISEIAPGFRALSISVEAAPVTQPQIASQMLTDACRYVSEQQPDWAVAHLAAWAEVFQNFGAKPKRTPCSAEALRKRVLRDGSLPAIDPVVDLYNAISLRFAIPVGGENIDAYVGQPRLCVAEGNEQFDTVKDGETTLETVDAGEVIWRDDLGVTCRRWNWRQGIRTRLDARAGRMWFILESLPAMPLSAVEEAGDALIAGLEALMPGAVCDSRWLGNTQN
ncbi:B3/4 domain-containing protein [Erwinia sp. JUb26]|uniref:B3/B4 domain-containing protein n=1 Tax=Erwinia sp. JUb26 TaxID=2485126 RepID=UPI000F47F979|nr:B3/4 domain-containing protein [Erwinia sp. JUb26]ROR15078.1 DNA/RNA-binding domain of Phe-tRNA-synthetase-like protein [Erwinia sp. JUb26]